MTTKKISKAVNDINTTAVADGSRYSPTEMGEKIRPSDPDTKNIISSTFGMIKSHILELLESSVGFNQNVNLAYYQSMTDPSQSIEYEGRRFYQHPGVGTIKAYNDAGNPSQGCFTIHTMA